ncbi:unnamed protein product [Meganyctiphanes norvegica]|uniref:Ankyrin repeat domain-containing protein n=1 Tax=Meganyctiphanes norvegica TaxID=48144 RepID=A0AAV2SE40_MEGNR
MGKLAVVCFAALVGAILATNGLDLWNAAKLGDLDSVNEILASGTDPNWRNPASYNQTALHIASDENNLAVVNALLAGGADIDALDNYGWTPIMYATSYGHLNIVQTLIAANANLTISLNNKGRWEGYTVLHIAAKNNKTEIAELLLEAGADKKQQDINGKTPGYVARENKHIDLANMIDNYTYTPDINLTLIITGVICGSAVFISVISYLVVRCVKARHARDKPEQPHVEVKEHITFVNEENIEMEHIYEIAD